MPTKQVFRIVVASPSDLHPERDALNSAINIELNQLLRDLEYSAEVDLYRYETDAYPGLHEAGPQGLIDSRLKIEDSDVLIGVFWKRFGTPVGDSGSGTEHEIRKALDARKAKGSPQVMLYFSNNAIEPSALTDVMQFKKVQEFRAELEAIEPLSDRPYVSEYKGSPAEFAAKVLSDVRKFIFEQIRKTLADEHIPELRYSFSATPTILRSEGITELISNCFLQCKYESAASPQTPLWFSAVLTFPQPVTSRQNEPFILEVGRPGAEACYVSSAVSGNQVFFGRVHLDNLQPFETRNFQIGNIRINASGVVPNTKVIANITVGNTHVANGTQVVGITRIGLQFEVRDAASREPISNVVIKVPRTSDGKPTRIATLRFIESFDNAFKSRKPTGTGIRICENTIVYTSEDYLGPAPRIFDMRIAKSVDCGTCLRAIFCRIPSGVRLFVPVASWSPIHAEIVESASILLSGGAIEIDALKIRELRINEHGTGTAVWEVVRPTPVQLSVAGYVDLPIFASVSAEAMLGSATVNASFGPASVMTLSSPGPIPRFLDTSKARLLFKIEAD